MRRKTNVILAAAAVIMLLQALAYAEDGNYRRHRRPKGPDAPPRHEMRERHHRGIFGNLLHMQKEFGLTDEQIKSITDINRKYEQKMLDFREKLAPKRIQFKKLFLSENVDLEKVRSLLQEMSSLRNELYMLRIKQRLDIEKILTPEQKSKIKKYRFHMRRKWR